MHTEALAEVQKALDLDENSWVAYGNLVEFTASPIAAARSIVAARSRALTPFANPAHHDRRFPGPSLT